MFSNRSAGDLLLPTRYVMVAASRSGSTSAVMRLSSPRASTFSSQRSRSLALAARGGSATGLAASPSLFGLIVTLMSMVLLRPCSDRSPDGAQRNPASPYACPFDEALRRHVAHLRIRTRVLEELATH